MRSGCGPAGRRKEKSGYGKNPVNCSGVDEREEMVSCVNSGTKLSRARKGNLPRKQVRDVQVYLLLSI